jgi:hypothetical protein
MNDEHLKKLFREMKYGEPSEIEVARWKRVVRRELLDRSPSEWLRLAVACVIGIVIGAAIFRSGPRSEQKNDDRDSTIERVYVNIQ